MTFGTATVRPLFGRKRAGGFQLSENDSGQLTNETDVRDRPEGDVNAPSTARPLSAPARPSTARSIFSEIDISVRETDNADISHTAGPLADGLAETRTCLHGIC
jgi:hypothetical protein